MEINPNILIGSGVLLIGITSLAVKIADNGNHKRKKIYERIEQERKDTEEKFVSTKLCDERSGNIQTQLIEIGKDVKTILSNGSK